MTEINTGKGQKGIIFNIQTYSIHDGPGIRTTVFFKGCPLRCFWCQNPESQSIEPEVLLNKKACTRCGKCVAVCPAGASRLSEASSMIDRSKCIGCGKCVEACPNQVRSLAGKWVTVDEVVAEVLKDKKFYDNSGGGVTLSGGEPTFQPEFALEILRRCHEAGIHTVLETCGYTSWRAMDKVLEYTDLVLYDVKCTDTNRHKKATGKLNHLILDNARKISTNKPMIVRVPLVPAFNDTAEYISAIAEFVKTQLGKLDIQLLAYNKLGEGKYERLDRACVHLEPQSEKQMRALEAIVKQ